MLGYKVFILGVAHRETILISRNAVNVREGGRWMTTHALGLLTQPVPRASPWNGDQIAKVRKHNDYLLTSDADNKNQRTREQWESTNKLKHKSGKALPRLEGGPTPEGEGRGDEVCESATKGVCKNLRPNNTIRRVKEPRG